ncbi:MAG: hypothetical protein KDD63_25315, partial [Bacteroidetes bacterium]|nr:hypothetical protein [Bacteroidota bacterium]
QVFDGDMNLIWEQNETTEKDDQLFDIRGVVVDNLGNVNILTQEFFKLDKDIEKSKEKLKAKTVIDGKPNYQYSLMSYRNKGTETKAYLLKPEEGFLRKIRMETNNRNDLIIFGFFGNEKSYENTQGFYYQTIDGTTGEVSSERFEYFSQEFIDEFAEKEKDKGRNELWNVNAYAIIPAKNGDFIVLGEFFRSTTSTTYKPDGLDEGFRTTQYYNYGDILIWRVNPQNGIVWYDIIPKYQRTAVASIASSGMDYFYVDDANRVRGGVGSFIWAAMDDGIKMLYCEDPKQKEDFKKKKSGVTSDFVWSLVEVSWDGESSEQILKNNIPQKAWLVPGACSQTGPSKMLLLANERWTYQLGTIIFR